MAASRLLTGSKAVIARRAQRRRRNQPAENAGRAREASAAVPPGSSDPEEDGQGSAVQARLLRKASAHEWMAAQVTQLMQGNVARSEDLRRLAGSMRPAVQLAEGSRGSRLPAPPSPRDEVEMLDRIVAWQTKTISWHRNEGRLLREQAAGLRRRARGDWGDPDRR